ncbi:papain-like cysteine protease family protein [Amycolatopsis tolypomycina]|uniref:Papain-like cysteine protease AvrRpt2 n=1 Tax=Amycolatopsis tolypomycina TaxID=208445 RepID=A0A1H5AAK2_9PSEU|nr:papain-like cysteine protease family protein [Amycolatopsis tolypomycina]SED39262.1 Papain-like cysteine protease AvrRpt2 [Amycolatopsis tolypomycina]
MIDLPVNYIRQPEQHLCWYTSLRMIFEYRRGAGVEVVGHVKALAEGQAQAAKRAAIEANRGEAGDYETRRALRNEPPRGLADDETAELAEVNGMRDLDTPSAGWTSDLLERALRDHGPLWCAIEHAGAATKHVVVAKGVNAAGQVVLHDPQFGPNLPWEVANFTKRLLKLPHSLLYLPA